MLTYDAWLKTGKKFALYYYEVSNGEDTVQFSPTHFVDITATEPRKRAACLAHESQHAGTGFYPSYHVKMHMFRGMESGFKLVLFREEELNLETAFMELTRGLVQ